MPLIAIVAAAAAKPDALAKALRDLHTTRDRAELVWSLWSQPPFKRGTP